MIVLRAAFSTIAVMTLLANSACSETPKLTVLLSEVNESTATITLNNQGRDPVPITMIESDAPYMVFDVITPKRTYLLADPRVLWTMLRGLTVLPSLTLAPHHSKSWTLQLRGWLVQHTLSNEDTHLRGDLEAAAVSIRAKVPMPTSGPREWLLSPPVLVPGHMVVRWLNEAIKTDDPLTTYPKR